MLPLQRAMNRTKIHKHVTQIQKCSDHNDNYKLYDPPINNATHLQNQNVAHFRKV